ncbi:hypothetical protein NC651_021734 [Populus alba x Populus x berolinensis]|nr:hypothetical protein NC651_021734 [Populus alba x Populus x berolinensis]
MIHHILHKTEPVYENSFAAACFLQLAQEHRNFHQNFNWEGSTAPHFFQISPWLPEMEALITYQEDKPCLYVAWVTWINSGKSR